MFQIFFRQQVGFIVRNEKLVSKNTTVRTSLILSYVIAKIIQFVGLKSVRMLIRKNRKNVGKHLLSFVSEISDDCVLTLYLLDYFYTLLVPGGRTKLSLYLKAVW